MTKDYQEIGDLVEHVAEVCDSVEFVHGVPVKLPSGTKALLRGRIRNALTTYGNARELQGVEKCEEKVDKWEKEFNKNPEAYNDIEAIGRIRRDIEQIKNELK